MIAARQIFLGRGGGGAKLPYDAEVEYLESTGTQFIDTGINPQSSTTWSTDIVCLPNSGITFMSLIGYAYTSLGVQSVGVSRGLWAQTSLSVDHTNPTLVHADQIGQSFNGVQGNSNNIGKGLLYLFNRTNVLTQYPWKGKIYSAKIWVSILVRDMIPVRFTNELGQSEGAMYDRVSGQLFRNQGTGAFLYGGDVYSVPVETSQYVQDGLVAMWDGEENAGVGKRCDTATMWVDLSGNGYDIALPSSGSTWDADHIVLSSTSLNTYLPEVSRAEFTIECVASAAGSGAIVWMKNPSWVGGALVGWANGDGKCYYPWANIGTVGNLNLHSVSLSWSASSQKLLVDGSVIASTSGTIDSRNVLSQIFLGEYNGSKMSAMNGYSVRLYSRALTAAEVAANYAVDKARFNLP